MLAEKIKQIYQNSRKLQETFFRENLTMLAELSMKMGHALENGQTIFFFGNGGSAAQAQHLAAEFINRFLFDRAPLAALSLTCDSAVITAIANDYQFSDIFRRQLAGLAKPGDVAVAISTSGNSPNVAKALEYAHHHHLLTVGLLGHDGGICQKLCDFPLVVKSDQTPRIQELHLLIGHLLCEMVEAQVCTRKC